MEKKWGSCWVLPQGMDGPGLDECRQRAITIMSVAGLAGLPQVRAPASREPLMTCCPKLSQSRRLSTKVWHQCLHA